MPSIYLKQTTGTYNAELDTVSITLTEEIHSTSNLFKKYKHTLQTATNGNIYIFNDTYRDCVTDGSNCLTITSNNGYQDDKLTEAHVYYNHYDPEKTPLVLVFKFQNGYGSNLDKYYTRSKFGSKLSGSHSENITSLQPYGSENDILKDLLTENDNIKELLTYDIGKIKGDSPPGNGNGLYNCGKITVQLDTGGEPKLSENGFSRYKHTPVVNGDAGNENKNACVIFDGNVLMQKEGNKEVDGIQKEQYKEIIVYMGERVKKESAIQKSQTIEVPLLIELTKKARSSEPDYYVHKRNSNGYYWEQLPGNNGKGEVLCDLLTDMGFGMTNGEPGYEKLKKLLTSATVLNGQVGSEDLSNKLNGLKGKQLQTMLKQQVGNGESGSSQKSFLELLLKQIEFDLLDSVIILLEKRNPPNGSTYGETVVKQVVGNLQPPREINRVKMENGGKIITVNDQTADKGTCVQKYKYKVYEHDFSSLVQEQGQDGKSHVGIRFVIPTQEANQYKQLAFYSTIELQAEPQNLEYKYYHKNGKNGDGTTNQTTVYVWFYDGGDGKGKGDPRPLMLCVNNTTYAPKNKKTYFTEWYKVDVRFGSGSTNECGCPSSGETGTASDKLLENLDKVVRFLNKVDIKQVGSSNGQPHHYPVQTFKNQKIQIEVTCSPVGDSDSPPPDGTCSTSISNISCYKKFEHKPIGMTNGEANNGTGYRLGEVVYNGGGGGNPKGTLNYKTPESKHQYNPLVGVTVFYYDQDKNYADPLLIELEFKTIGGNGTGPKEYYRLKEQGRDSNGEMKWELDGTASGKMDSDLTAVQHLDSIRYDLKKVVKILIEKQTQYPLCLSQQVGGKGDGYTNGNGKQIEVKECIENGCLKLSQEGYKCYVHQISTINGNAGTFDYNSIGGLKFFISGSGGDIEIKLHNSNGNSGSTEINEITYNTCMADIFVYFYCKPGLSSSPDTVPLMLRYNAKYYRPEDRDQYFKEWSCDSSLSDFKNPCGSEDDESNYELLAGILDLINEKLNRIDLDCPQNGSCKNYGLPVPGGGKELSSDFNRDRVNVTCQEGPSRQPITNIYKRVTHRTVNGSRIGEIHYNKNDITEAGIQIDGNSKIFIEDSGHSFFVTDINKPNTVIAYYHKDDSGFKLPQLIVLMETPGPISDDKQPITAKPDSKYGYYVLATNGGGNNYKYEWRRPYDEHPPNQLTLDDETEFSLLNSVVIMIDQQSLYDESTIKTAFQNSEIRSPGNLEGVNRLKEKTINVAEETRDGGSNYGGSGQCVSKYGYRLYAHNITALVKWNGSSEQSGISLIGGLRFLVPSSENATGYQEISLYFNQEIRGPVQRLYHSPPGTQNTSSQNKVYVFFYGSDPRPLLLCYEKNAYIPKKLKDPRKEKQVDVDYTKWLRVNEINQCTCMGNIFTNDDRILDALLEVVCFLNPVQLNPNQIPTPASTTITQSPFNTTYDLHKFTPKITIQIQIIRDNINCYKKFSYKPLGTKNGKNGNFRLGNVIYTDTNRFFEKPEGNLDYTTNSQHKYYPLKTVDVYFYDKDSHYMDPLLVVLYFKKFGDSGDGDNGPKEYWKLRVRYTGKIEWEKDPKADTEVKDGGQKLVNYLDSIRYLLKKLVRIEIQRNSKGNYRLMGRTGGSTPGTGFGHILRDKNRQVAVSECSGTECQKLRAGSYVCFRHNITGLKDQDHHQIGGVVMTLPSKKGDNYAVELSFYENTEQTSGGSIRPNGQGDSTHISTRPIQLLYNSCMNKGDITVFVYFYVITRGGRPDTVPLIVCYNKRYYRPENRDEYLTKWIHESLLEGTPKHCGTYDNDVPNGYKTLIETLDFTNEELNRIDLTHTINGKHTFTYGIPLPEKSPNELGIDLSRVKVTKIPRNTKPERPYCKLIHRTINEFKIGQIWYNKKEISQDGGILVNGNNYGGLNGPGTKIEIKGPFYILLANENKTNTVAVYYSTTDIQFKVPQLILVMTTNRPIDQWLEHEIANKPRTRYGYYIIATNGSGDGKYKYEWREPKEKLPPEAPPKPLTLDDSTELSILNSVVILLEKRPKSGTSSPKNDKYEETDIKSAIEKAIESETLKSSPGLDKDINRLKKKDITMTDEAIKATGLPSLKDTGFRAISHDLSNIVKLDIKGISEVTLIARLIFLIPTPDGGGQYRLLSLYESVQPPKVVTLFHQKDKNCVCVYFYDKDPRPLMLIYNERTYMPFNKNDYFSKWVFDDNSGNSECSKIAQPILRALVYVSNFLNTVMIFKHNGNNYPIHKFNGQIIKINLKEIRAKDRLCYHKYIHKPDDGFRLGNITYASVCIFRKDDPDKCINSLITDTTSFEPASEVVVYYYQGDPHHKNPLLVVLCKKSDGVVNNGPTTTCQSKQYYELQRSSTISTKMYKKCDNTIKLEDRAGTELEKTLDKILFYISKSLLIDLSFRKTTKITYSDTSKDWRAKNYMGTYSATVYENQESGPKKQVKTSESMIVQVSGPIELLADKKEKTGYKCYQHKLTNIKKVKQIGGLRLELYHGQYTPLTLLDSCNKGSGQQSQPIDPIAYTTCKGDLYVYFYGSDPRPLLLCYNNDSYAPKALNKYNSEWHRVDGIQSCECSEPGFDPSKGLLKTLYKISMFLNPVKLSETLQAYNKVKKFIEDEKAKQKKGQQTVDKIDKLPEHNYTVQTFGDTDIKMKVQATDLLCYRQSIGNKGLLIYKMVCKLNLIMYYIYNYVKIYTGKNIGK